MCDGVIKMDVKKVIMTQPATVDEVRVDTLVKCQHCAVDSVLSRSVEKFEVFYDREEPDEKHWSVKFYTAHCWQCGKTSFFETGI